MGSQVNQENPPGRKSTKSPLPADQLGSKIKAARKRLGWSQQRLADEVGVVNQAISQYENGGGIEDSTLRKIALKLNDHFDIDWLKLALLAEGEGGGLFIKLADLLLQLIPAERVERLREWVADLQQRLHITPGQPTSPPANQSPTTTRSEGPRVIESLDDPSLSQGLGEEVDPATYGLDEPAKPETTKGKGGRRR